MSYCLISPKGVIWGIVFGSTVGLIKGDTRSLDYSSYTSHTAQSPGMPRTASWATGPHGA